jgi:hypothetical protein
VILQTEVSLVRSVIQFVHDLWNFAARLAQVAVMHAGLGITVAINEGAAQITSRE